MASGNKRRPPPRDGTEPLARGRAKFCREITDTIVQWLRLGNFRESAAARARCSPEALGLWLKRGREELEAAGDDAQLSEHAEFYLAVIEAEAEAEHTMVGQILSGDNEDRRWFLERRYPSRYGKLAQRIEVSGPNGGPVQVDDARRILLAKLVAQAAAEGAPPTDPESDAS